MTPPLTVIVVVVCSSRGVPVGRDPQEPARLPEGVWRAVPAGRGAGVLQVGSPEGGGGGVCVCVCGCSTGGRVWVCVCVFMHSLS